MVTLIVKPSAVPSFTNTLMVKYVLGGRLHEKDCLTTLAELLKVIFCTWFVTFPWKLIGVSVATVASLTDDQLMRSMGKPGITASLGADTMLLSANKF